jgi:hypothetical protein
MQNVSCIEGEEEEEDLHCCCHTREGVVHIDQKHEFQHKCYQNNQTPPNYNYSSFSPARSSRSFVDPTCKLDVRSAPRNFTKRIPIGMQRTNIGYG